MIKTTNMILDELSEYSSPRTKLSRMVKKGDIFPIVKGLYETEKSTPGFLLAGSIYGPSYISFEYALSFYGLIPEAVYTVTSATFEKKKSKKYETMFGTFTYRDVPSEVFPLGLKLMQEGTYYYRIATPEKAVCDMLYTLPPASNAEELHLLLNESLRIDDMDLKNLNTESIIELSEHYHTTNVKRLCTLVRRLHK
ncbi:type IV toxin-antitoxin system AbiEi family antitoxin domain-containing protein [Dielma fastidiosa]|uniref:type IV toxin-antitoxin system AbiEi family antitoxin domain-containing protein n=1 Tax=Dielma fastidiosa TaxID=1034346 RepID=UPI0034B6E37F